MNTVASMLGGLSVNENLDLAELFNHYGTDKDRNGYSQIYHTLFAGLRNQPLHLLEIGIGTMIPGVSSSMVGYSLPDYRPGGGLRAWRDFFRQGHIYGVDVQPDTQFQDDRIETYLGNSTKSDEVERLVAHIRERRGRDFQFDIIIDDGSHWEGHQYQTLTNFFPYVRGKGFYVIEDICPGSKISNDPKALEVIVGRSPFFFVGAKNNICVVFKDELNSQRQGY